MKLIWRLPQEGNSLEVVLLYNMYLGTKKIFFNNIEILSLGMSMKNNIIEFTQAGKDYKLELMAENYGYEGTLVTPEGNRVSGEKIRKEYIKPPFWIIPFVIFNMSIPIISVEAFTPWLIGVAASYFTSTIAKKKSMNLRKRVVISVGISILAWILYFLFYLHVKSLGFNGGFIPFKR